MAGLSTGAGPPVVNVYHEKSMILPDVSRVLACLYEKDVKFETIKASYKDLLSLQASRSVPVPFYDGPVFLQDSRAICRYIAETYEHQGYPFLLGKDVLERAAIEQWLRHEEHTFDPPSRALFCHLAFPLQEKDDDDTKDINREKQKLEEVLEVYEQRLSETDFLAGNKFTLADLVHLPGTHHVITSERFAYLYDSRKNVQRWWNRISARDSWQQVLRDMKTVEEEHVKEELEKQQKMQRQTEPLPQFGGRDIRIDPQMQEGTKPQTVLVAPPSTGTVSTSISEHIKDVRSDDEKFKTERLQRKLTESEATELQPQPADSEEPDIPKKPSETLSKKAAEVDQNRVTSPAQEEPSVAQNAQRQAKAPPADPEVSDLSPLQVESKEDAKGNTSDERFKAERLKKMFYESEEAQLQSQPEDSQAPTKEEAPVIPKKPSDLQDIAKQDTMIPDNEKINGSPSTGRRAASTPTNADKSITISPPKGGMGQDDRGLERSPSINEQEPIPPVPRKSETTSAWSAPTSSKPIPPPIQQGPPTAPSTDKLDKAAGVDLRAPQGAPQQTPTYARNDSGPVQGTDPSAHVTSDEQSDKSSTMGERAPEVSPSKTPPSDSRSTSAPIQEAIRDAQEKQAPGGGGEIPDAGYSGEGDTTKKSVDKTTAEPTSSSQETTGPIKGVSPSTRGITGDESAKAAMVDASAASLATVQAPASGRQNDSTVLRGGTADANGKNEALIPSPADQRSMLPTTPGSLARTPDTQRRTASGQMSGQSAPLPALSDTRNKKTDLAETSQARTNEQPGGRVPKNAGVSSSGPSTMTSQEYINEAYKEGAYAQQLPREQSRTQLAENKKKQGDDPRPLTITGKPTEDDFWANANDNKTGQNQATTDAPSKLQVQSNQNRTQPSKDGGMGTNKTANSPTLATSREVLSPPEKSMGQQQLQDDRSSTTLQNNVKQGTEAAALGSGTEQKRKKDLLTNADKNNGETPVESKSEEETSSDTQQVKNNRINSKSDSSSEATQFEGNEGNLPESERRGS